eukprot:407523-Rhodomonas_salina.2
MNFEFPRLAGISQEINLKSYVLSWQSYIATSPGQFPDTRKRHGNRQMSAQAKALGLQRAHPTVTKPRTSRGREPAAWRRRAADRLPAAGTLASTSTCRGWSGAARERGPCFESGSTARNNRVSGPQMECR